MNLFESNKSGEFRGESTGKDMNQYLKKTMRKTATIKKFSIIAFLLLVLINALRELRI
jgi:hypothetical protein